MKSSAKIKQEVKEGYSVIASKTPCCDTTCCSPSEKKKSKDIKEEVKKGYSEIAEKADSERNCCASSCCEETDNIFYEDYKKLDGYNPDAELFLGCGLPTKAADIKEGNTVLDLGSGAGNDVFVARAATGEKGHVIGVDFTEAMIKKANKNKQKTGFKNVEFRLGDIENLPVDDNLIDVVISNCVLNLVPDKEKAFSEIYRVLKPGAHFAISDIVTEHAPIPEELREATEMYIGCVAGAMLKEDYLRVIEKAGFKNIEIRKSNGYFLEDEALKQFLTDDQIKIYKTSGVKITSITVYAEK